MGTFIAERPLELRPEDWDEWETMLADGSGGNNRNKKPKALVGGEDDEDKGGIASLPNITTAQKAGQLGLEQTVIALEARWEAGEPLSAEEQQLMREHENLLDDPGYDY